MLLKKVGKWNNIPDYMMPEMPPQGTKVIFKILNIEFTDPEGNKRLNQTYTFPATSSVYDEKNRKTIPIGIIKETDDRGENPVFHKIFVEPNKTAGTKAITIGESVLGDEEYVYLMLHHGRKDNPYAPANSDILFELLDVKGDVIRESKLRQQKYAAVNHAMGLKDHELPELAILFGIEDTSDLELVRAQIEGFAESDPKGYMDRVNDDDKQIHAVIKQALAQGLVYRDGFELRLKSPASKILDLSADSDALIPQEYARYIKGHAQGDKLLELLKSQVKEGGRKGGRPKKSEE